MGKRRVVCMCDKEFEVDVPECVDLDENTEVLESIKNGDFMAHTCPACAKLLKPEFPLRLLGRSLGLDVFFIPELHRYAYLNDKLDYAVQKTKRVVIGYHELVEKISIFEAGLDDRIIEIMKFYLLTKAYEDEACEEQKIMCFFKECGNENLQFHVYGMRLDEVGVWRVPLEIYEDTAQSISEKAKERSFAEILQTPYVSVNKVFGKLPF